MKKKKMSLTTKRSITGYMFILPWLVGFLVFYLRSLFMTANFSLSEISVAVGGGYDSKFVGLQNYLYAFRVHGSFKQVLTTSIGNMLVDVPLITFFSLLMAMLLNKKFRGRTLLRAIFFLPVIMNSSAINAAIEFRLYMLAGLGLPESLLEYVVGAVARINDIISASGVQIIIFIAALQSIPGSLY